MAIAAIQDLEVDHMDVSNAFLNGTLKEDVYMQQPPGYEIGDSSQVCKLVKALYGTRQAPHEWNNDINDFILSLEFTRCKSDSCIYVKTSGTGKSIIVSLFVDDIIPIYSSVDKDEWSTIRAKFLNKYKMKDMGPAKWVLGMSVIRDRARRTIHIGQELYLKKILKTFGMESCKSSHTPAEDAVLSSKDSPATIEEGRRTKYMAMVGSLLYAMLSTRWDIAQSVSALTRFMQNPGPAHMKAAEQVMRYMKGTTDRGLEYNGLNGDGSTETQLKVTVYTDADWAKDRNDCKSITGYIVKLNDCVISWSSKKQSTIALSSAESEYYALGSGTQQLLWTKSLLAEVMMQSTPITATMKTDSQSAMAMCNKDNMHSRTKHIDVRHHFIRDHLKNKVMELQWVPTHHQLADILTKPLNKVKFKQMRDRIANWREGDAE